MTASEQDWLNNVSAERAAEDVQPWQYEDEAAGPPAQAAPADEPDYPNLCGICNALLGDEQREADCPAGHSPEALAAWDDYCSGGEDHLPDCREFSDMDGSAQCSCGGMRCSAGWTTGPRQDPYGTECDYIRRDHPRTEDGRHLLHRGPDPMIDGEWVQWTGGGTCAGDPLPRTIVGHLLACPLLPEGDLTYDEVLYDHMRDEHGWLMGGFERDDYSTLRALHRVALDNARREAAAAG